jgi:signal transduction histidine kinase
MLNSLRSRLVLSHILPSLVIIPLMGVLLIYVLTTRQLLPILSNDLARDARLIAALTRDQRQIWQAPAYAQQLLGQISADFPERTMLLRPDGSLLASTDPSDQARLNQVIEKSGLPRLHRGREVIRINYTRREQNEEVIETLAPVLSGDGKLIGVVRITYHFTTVYQEIYTLRYLIVSILLLGLITSAGLGAAIGYRIGRPVKQASQAILDLARGQNQRTRPENRLPEKGLTEIRMLASSVNFLVERLHSLEQARRQLLANLVHELGRPIGALRSANKAIRRGASQDPVLFDLLLSGTDQELERLEHLLEELSHLHDQVAGTLEMNLQALNLSEWLPRSLAAWQEAAAEKGLAWETGIPSDLPLIKADPIRLAQAIGNLASNAVKYTPAGGHVSVRVGSQGSSVWIRVKDSGPGVPLEEQEMIFQPFYRGSQASRFPQGLGLGLSIARDLVAAHGGELELESTPGAGSCFTIWLPY